MLSKRNSLPERIISLLMTIMAVSLVYICIKLHMPRDFWGIIEFIYSSAV